MTITIMRSNPHKTVADVMSSPVITIRDTDTYKHIVEVLQSSRISAVPVVAADDTVFGVVSESDLMLKEEGEVPSQGLHPVRHHRQQAKAEHVYAGELMTSPAIGVNEQTSIAEAARTMQKHGIRHLVVVDDDGRLRGILSRGDLLKVFLREDHEIQEQIVGDVIKREMMIDTAGVAVKVLDGRVSISGELERLSDIERLVRLVGDVDGVVDVQKSLTFRVDDMVIGPHVGPVGQLAGLRGR
jgi:CBS-domain-containing membrane protein